MLLISGASWIFQKANFHSWSANVTRGWCKPVEINITEGWGKGSIKFRASKIFPIPGKIDIITIITLTAI